MDRKAYANILDLLRRRADSYRALGPLMVCHHEQLRATPPEEIEAARAQRREISHLRIERTSEGWLEARIQEEAESYLKWSSPRDAPPTLERRINIETREERFKVVPARYLYGCNVDPELGR